MTTVKTVPQILDDAADILAAENAWTKGEWHEKCEVDGNGISHCADGALEYAAGLVGNFRFDEYGDLRWDRNNDEDAYDAYSKAYYAAGTYVSRLLGLRRGISRGIISYNDADDRTQDEVVAALRGAAEAVRTGKIIPRTVWEQEQMAELA